MIGTNNNYGYCDQPDPPENRPQELQIVNNSILPLRREQLRGPRRTVSTYVVADLRSAVSHILGGH
jgi:hypothetical protein